jgi:hypothetical protein
MLLALGWTVAEVVRRRADDATYARFARAGTTALVAVVLVVTVAFTLDASDVTVQSPRLNEALGAMVGPTTAALHEREAQGAKGPYLVTWLPDPVAIGSQGFGLLNELLRKGFDVKAGTPFRPGATRYHVMDPAAATLEIHMATGPAIDVWKADHPQDDEVAYFDPRNPAERREADRLYAEVVDELRAAGLDSSVADADKNLFMIGVDEGVPVATRDKIARILDLGAPTAVFIGMPSE